MVSETRRIRSDMIQIYKLVYGLDEVNLFWAKNMLKCFDHDAPSFDHLTS